MLQDNASCVANVERKTWDIKEISDNDKISIISPSKYKLNTSSGPVSQSEAYQAVLDSHGKQKIKDRGEMMAKHLSAYSMNPLSIKPPLKLKKRIVTFWILEPSAVLTKVVSAAQQFQFNLKEEISDLQEWIQSWIRDNMLWKQWSQEENYTENYEQQTYIGDVDRNSTPAQINMNIQTVRDILDQFNN